MAANLFYSLVFNARTIEKKHFILQSYSDGLEQYLIVSYIVYVWVLVLMFLDNTTRPTLPL